MRRVSKKRQQRLKEAKQVREALIAKHRRCMLCHRAPGGWRSQLCCHEIARGPDRDKALDKPYAILVLCQKCHMDEIHANSWSEARQLALLKQESPEDYDLQAYLGLTSPSALSRITEEEVCQVKKTY